MEFGNFISNKPKLVAQQASMSNCSNDNDCTNEMFKNKELEKKIENLESHIENLQEEIDLLRERQTFKDADDITSIKSDDDINVNDESDDETKQYIQQKYNIRRLKKLKRLQKKMHKKSSKFSSDSTSKSSKSKSFKFVRNVLLGITTLGGLYYSTAYLNYNPTILDNISKAIVF